MPNEILKRDIFHVAGISSEQSLFDPSEGQKIRSNFRILAYIIDNFLSYGYFARIRTNRFDDARGRPRAVGVLLQDKISEYFMAAAMNNVGYVRSSIESDISVNSFDPKHQNTALHYAASSGATDVIDYLLSVSDINPAQKNAYGHTPFDISMRQQAPEAIKDKLLDAEIAFLLKY